jgi:ankyrin repeat protein
MNRIDEELFDAAGEENQNLPKVLRLLSVGADVNTKDSEYGYTPLHEACSMGHVQVLQALLEHGADTEATSLSVRTPLHCACDNGHVAVVIELLSSNDSNGATTSILGTRKSRGGTNIEAKNHAGNTPLHLASVEGHLPVVKALLSGGANILAVNNDGRLPIHSAVNRSYRSSAVVKCLLQHFYATTRHLPLHELLIDFTWIGDPNHDIDVPPLRTALHRNVVRTNAVVEIIEYLVDRNPELITARDHDGSLPLHVACRRGASFPIVQSLVNLYKASVKSVTSEGDLPLFLACELPEPSLDTIFFLTKLYPDLVYR